MSLLPESTPTEADDESDTETTTAASNDTQEYLTPEETPFTLIRGTASRINHYILSDALDFHADIEHRGEAYNEDFQSACTMPPTGDIGRPHESEKRYWTAVAPSLATSSSVAWVGSMGVDLEADDGTNKARLREELEERFSDSFNSDVVGTATDMYVTIRENQQQHGRRTSLQELKAPKWSSPPRNEAEKEQAYKRLLPRVEAIEEPTRKNEPDWLWVSD